MGSLHVIDPGLFTTVQDLGRVGHAHHGVPRGGAADRLSLRIGNRLVGNPDNAAALEITLTGATFTFEHEATIALTGGEGPAHIVRPSAPPTAIAPRTAISLQPGDVVRIGPIVRGTRAYLCIRGGIEVPLVLGSAATLPNSDLGGFRGRRLAANDVLHFGVRHPAPTPRSLSATGTDWLLETLHARTIRATPGPHAASFDRATIDAFWNSAWIVSLNSNRTGIRLEGPSLSTSHRGDMESEGMFEGAVQLPPGGSPIILMPDRPTTGGYPVIASVAAADLPVLGQLRPRDSIRFTQIERVQSLELLRQQELWLNTELPPA